MRSQKISLGLVLLILGGISIVMVGCSGDDTPTSSNKGGAIADPNFLLVQTEIDDFVDATMEHFTNGLGSMSALGQGDVDPILYGPAVPATSDTSYYSGDWHIIESTWDLPANTFHLLDSLQFRDAAGDPQQTSISTASVTFKTHWTDVTDNTDITHTNLTGNADLVFTNLLDASNQATVNGTSDLLVEDKIVDAIDGTTLNNYDIEGTFVNVMVDRGNDGAWSNGTPVAGQLTVTVAMVSTVRSNDPVSLDWNVTVTFADGVARTHLTLGNLYWDWNRTL